MKERTRQFGDLRQSRSSKKDHLESSFSSRVLMSPKSQIGKASVTSFNSHYVCLNCINQGMSSDKKMHNHHRQALQKSRYNQLQRSRMQYEYELGQSREKRQAEDNRKLTDYNKSLIEMHERQRRQEQKAKQIARKRQQLEAARHQKQQEEEQAKRNQARDRFKAELANQINDNKQRKLRQQMKQRYPQPLPQDEGWDLSGKKQKYRQQLQEQIRQSQQKKKNEKLNNSRYNRDQQTLINDMVDQNNKRFIENQNSIKKQLKKQAQDFQASQEKKKQQKIQNKKKQYMQALINQQFEQKQQFQNSILRNERIKRYKKQIEQQIKQNELKRNKLKNADKAIYNSTIGLRNGQIERKLCDSCDKTYPKKYMTRIK